MTQLTILDVSTGRHVTGNLVRDYPQGVTIDDARGVRYYATAERVLTARQKPAKPTLDNPGTNGPLF